MILCLLKLKFSRKRIPEDLVELKLGFRHLENRTGRVHQAGIRSSSGLISTECKVTNRTFWLIQSLAFSVPKRVQIIMYLWCRKITSSSGYSQFFCYFYRMLSYESNILLGRYSNASITIAGRITPCYNPKTHLMC